MKKHTIPREDDWCPLAGLGVEGSCMDQVATVRVSTRRCSFREQCEKLLKEMDKENESGDLHKR